MRQKIINSILLLLAALVWGISFVAQKTGMSYVQPCTFNGIRMILGSVVLLPLIGIRWHHTENIQKQEMREQKKTLLIGGVICGVLLFIASTLQQYGIIYTSVGKSSFITALYVILVPILSVFMRKKVPHIIWFCACVAIVGFYFLCMSGGDRSIGLGDGLTLLCSVVFAMHVVCVGQYAPRVDGVCLSAIQFFVCGAISIVIMVFTETPQWGDVQSAGLSILYAGILSCGLAYTLQVVAQARVPAVLATLLLSMESVFGAVAGTVILGNHMTGREILGCALVFGAVILAQLPMPDLDGIATWYRMKDMEHLCKDTPVIMLTANAIVGAKEMYLKEGVSGYLSKPVSGDDLEKALIQYLPEYLIIQSPIEQSVKKTMEDLDSNEVEPTHSEGADTGYPFHKISVENAMQYYGNQYSLYDEILSVYKQEAVDNQIKLQKAYMTENWEEYSIYTHALKSTSRSIGADQLADTAFGLEQAGKENDIDYIYAHHTELMEQYAEIIDEIRKYI